MKLPQAYALTLTMFVLLVAGATVLSAAESDWPQFLGPDRNGISSETAIIDQWPTDGPKVLWRAPGGGGMSGLAIQGGKLFTMVQRDGEQQLIALNATTGKPLWSTPIAPTYKNQMGNGPRATPTVAGGRAFVFTGEGILAAVNVADGKVQWSHNVLSELKGESADYGMACSPLVSGDLVIVTAGAPQAAVVAYDIKSGKQAWTAGDEAAGYSSPALLKLGGKEQIVVFTGASVLGLAPTKGTLLWQFPFVTDFGCNIATPLAYRDQIFISSGENHGCALLALKPGDSGLKTTEVWSSLGPKSVLRNEWQTSILLDDHLYGFDNVGGAGPVSHLTCINAATGERAWQKVRFGKGNMISAAGKLLIVTMEGEFVMAKASPKAYEELGRAPVLGKTRQAPALANGLLYLRDDKEIVCLDLRAPAK